MKRAPSLWEFRQLQNYGELVGAEAQINGKWVPARPLGLGTIVSRLKLAWMVFTGKADAVVWPEGQ